VLSLPGVVGELKSVGGFQGNVNNRKLDLLITNLSEESYIIQK